MCGRSSLHDAPVNILDRLQLPPVLPGFEPRYNIAPSQLQWTLSLDEGGSAAARTMQWGLVPSWAKDASGGSRMINARAESLSSRAAYSEALKDRRCLILADGYYEWTPAGRTKVPMFFHLAGHEAFAFAGLWDRWEGGVQPLDTCTIITTRASTMASAYHHRMPAMLTTDSMQKWMDPTSDEATFLALLKPYEGADLQTYEVSRLVNSPLNDSAECIAPATSVTKLGASPPDQLELGVPGLF
ncbi:MAG: SOS response-associated peptidase [Gemmatimonadota bacterium]|nr:SOS response-associated peptidase [Gemmatimonadota bacterium]